MPAPSASSIFLNHVQNVLSSFDILWMWSNIFENLQIKSVSKWKKLLNNCYKTISGHFFDITSVQVILVVNILCVNEYLNEELRYRDIIYVILKLLAWQICNMKKEFLKKSNITWTDVIWGNHVGQK